MRESKPEFFKLTTPIEKLQNKYKEFNIFDRQERDRALDIIWQNLEEAWASIDPNSNHEPLILLTIAIIKDYSYAVKRVCCTPWLSYLDKKWYWDCICDALRLLNNHYLKDDLNLARLNTLVPVLAKHNANIEHLIDKKWRVKVSQDLINEISELLVQTHNKYASDINLSTR